MNPCPQEALEPSLTSPLRGIAQSGIGARVDLRSYNDGEKARFPSKD